MTGEQYKRANNLVFPVLLIVLGYMTFVIAAAMLTGDVSSRTVIQLVGNVVGILIMLIGFLVKRDKKAGAICLVAGAALAYFVTMCVNSSPMCFAYAFPIMFASMVFLNVRMMLYGDVLVVLGTIIQIVRLLTGGILAPDIAIIEGFVVVLCVMASLTAARMLDKFNKEQIAVIEEKAKDQLDKAKNMTLAAENLMDHFDKAGEVIGQVSECINTNNFSMENIAQSTESTADAVQKQAAMCSEINHSTEVAETEIEQMLSAADKTLATVNEGVELIQELESQSQIVKKASSSTVESTTELTKKIEEVEGIVGAILSISAQTNLLALNASIEAARAGDAGKGFAVVADEIRQLSEQTKDSVNQITEIINDLNEYAEEANHSVADAIDSIEKQNDMIANSHQKFMVISEEVSTLAQIVEKTDGIMKEIFNNTNVISENISQLSATSEEVAACSTEGLTTSGEAVKEMNEFNRLLDSLNTIAVDLKSYASVDE